MTFSIGTTIKERAAFTMIILKIVFSWEFFVVQAWNKYIVDYIRHLTVTTFAGVI